MAQYLRDHGEVPAPRWEHVVTNSVRTTDVAQIGWNQVRLPHGLLLTTDGVHKVLTDQRMAALLSRSGTVEQRVTRLVAAAAAEGADNASAMLVEEAICWPPTAVDRDRESPGPAVGGPSDLVLLAAA